MISDIGPVKGADNPNIVCGLNAQAAQMTVSANPGSMLSIQWSGGDGNENVRNVQLRQVCDDLLSRSGPTKLVP